MAFRHSVRIRYGECDMQRVVFNAHYLAYVDDAVEMFVRTALGSYEAHGFDFMLKKVTVEWQSPATHLEVLDLDVAVARWGTSSFDVSIRGSVSDRPVFDVVAVYVSVTPGSPTAAPVPDPVRAALSSV